MATREIHVVEGECWKCNSRMKIAFGFTEGLAHSPEEFSVEELEVARKAGAKLEVSYSHTMNGSYMANICPRCSALTGSFYLHDFWDLSNVQTKVKESTACPTCADEYTRIIVRPLQ